MNQEDVRVSFYLKKSEADEQGECPIMGRLNVGKYSEAAFSMKMTAPGIRMAFRSCHGEERKVKGNQPAVGRDTRFGTLHLSGLVCPSGESIGRGGEMYPFGHGLRAGNFGSVLPQFHKEIREESRNQSCGRHGHILQVCLRPSHAVSQQEIQPFGHSVHGVGQVFHRQV